MEQSHIVFSPEALADLQNIEDYIAEQSGVERAKSVLARLHRSLNMLALWPNAGRLHRELEGTPRSFPVSPWIIFYEPAPHLDGIHILRVLDGRRDLDEILSGRR